MHCHAVKVVVFKSEKRMIASVLKQDRKTLKVQKNAIY